MCREGIFFFQAEDGIRDSPVTGVQTCALPISTRACFSSSFSAAEDNFSLSLPLIIIRAPASANPLARASPIPSEEPVISAVLSFKLNRSMVVPFQVHKD